MRKKKQRNINTRHPGTLIQLMSEALKHYCITCLAKYYLIRINPKLHSDHIYTKPFTEL